MSLISHLIFPFHYLRIGIRNTLFGLFLSLLMNVWGERRKMDRGSGVEIHRTSNKLGEQKKKGKPPAQKLGSRGKGKMFLINVVFVSI